MVTPLRKAMQLCPVFHRIWSERQLHQEMARFDRVPPCISQSSNEQPSQTACIILKGSWFAKMQVTEWWPAPCSGVHQQFLADQWSVQTIWIAKGMDNLNHFATFETRLWPTKMPTKRMAYSHHQTGAGADISQCEKMLASNLKRPCERLSKAKVFLKLSKKTTMFARNIMKHIGVLKSPFCRSSPLCIPKVLRTPRPPLLGSCSVGTRSLGSQEWSGNFQLCVGSCFRQLQIQRGRFPNFQPSQNWHCSSPLKGRCKRPQKVR